MDSEKKAQIDKLVYAGQSCETCKKAFSCPIYGQRCCTEYEDASHD